MASITSYIVENHLELIGLALALLGIALTVAFGLAGIALAIWLR